MNAIEQLMVRKDDLYARIPVVTPGEPARVTRNTLASGTVVENPPIRIEMKFPVVADDILSCNIDALAEQIDSAADQKLEAVMKHLFETNRRMSEAAGTAVDAKGEPFTFELWLRGLVSCPSGS